jgi:hypothetical protein
MHFIVKITIGSEINLPENHKSSEKNYSMVSSNNLQYMISQNWLHPKILHRISFIIP